MSKFYAQIGPSLMHLGPMNNQNGLGIGESQLRGREKLHNLILIFFSSCLPLCHSLTVLITVALEQILISGNVSPSTLFFFSPLFGMFSFFFFLAFPYKSYHHFGNLYTKKTFNKSNWGEITS